MQEALYRKYRPNTLDELVGQPDAVALISEQVSKKNLGHADLIKKEKTKLNETTPSKSTPILI